MEGRIRNLGKAGEIFYANLGKTKVRKKSDVFEPLSGVVGRCCSSVLTGALPRRLSPEVVSNRLIHATVDS